MVQWKAATLVEMVKAVESVKGITAQYPELQHVAEELLMMQRPLPALNGGAIGARPKRAAIGARPKRGMSAARRKQLSLAAKERWRKAKKAGKKTIGGGD